jgi:hypothetical protein
LFLSAFADSKFPGTERLTISAGIGRDSHAWERKNVEQLRACDSLVVICGKNHTATPELAMMAG